MLKRFASCWVWMRNWRLLQRAGCNEGHRRKLAWPKRFGTIFGTIPLMLCPMALADVGLPAYQDPVAGPPTVAVNQGPLVKNISYNPMAVKKSRGKPLRCAPGDNTTTLNLAPPSDIRIDDWSSGPKEAPRPDHAEFHIPIYVNGKQSALKTGNIVNQVNAIGMQDLGMQERLLLISPDQNYFRRLQVLRPMDKLLVRSPTTVRHYRVTRVGLSQLESETELSASSETLTLAACYPFQSVAGNATLYLVRAHLIPAAMLPSPNNQQPDPPTKMNF